MSYTSDNSIRQAEEAAALSCIYEGDWKVEDAASRSYSVRVLVNGWLVSVALTMVAAYPSQAPPKYDISAPWMDRKSKERLRKDLAEIYWKNIGEPVIFLFIEKIRDALQKLKPAKTKTTKVVQAKPAIEVKCPEIITGKVITDRKSSFQGHAARVTSVEEVNAVLVRLKENKKIFNAKHNVFAYRIGAAGRNGAGALELGADDGEAQAGGRALHLLRALHATDTLIVITRWYGGIQLGADRFRHYNNAARQALQLAGLEPKK